MRLYSKSLIIALTTAASLSVSNLSAAVMGSFASDGNGTNITITLSSISFGAPPNLRVTSSSLTYGSGTLLAVGTTGTISNASSLPVDPFMTFSGTPLDFKLLGFGTGDTSDPHDCSSATSNGKSCSLLLPGGFVSPVILTFDSGGTDATLFVFGTVTDGSGVTSNWSGHLGTTLTADLSTYTNPQGSGAPTPQDIFAYFQAHPNGAFTSSHSDTFTATVPATTPEPGTWALMLGGLLSGAGAISRRRRKTQA